VTIVTCHPGEWPVKYPGEADLCQATGDTCAARSAGVVEPVFANICVQKRMHRTKLKVDVQWRLFALVHNLGKIHTFGRSTDLWRRETSVRTPSERESGLSTNGWPGNVLPIIRFSTVSLGTSFEKVVNL
jgi:uncharacterized protein